MRLIMHHRLDRPDLGLGLVRVEGIEVGTAPTRLAAELDLWIAKRKEQPLTPEEEAVRQGCRTFLRNGKYKPTGRGKPASEYLMRTALEEVFPRINGPVDANNLLSLQHCVPISLWDLDLVGTNEAETRLGRAGERYVFNATGQVLELEDLVCGCGLRGGESLPAVTPIKDSMAAKLRPESKRLAGCIYYPLGAGSAEHLAELSRQFLDWLLTCGPSPSGASGICLPGQTVEI